MESQLLASQRSLKPPSSASTSSNNNQKTTQTVLRVVNRNLILEEYWMEYIDEIVQRELNWWDIERQISSTFHDLMLFHYGEMEFYTKK